MADLDTKVTKPTRYFILRRNIETGRMSNAAIREARGAEKVLADYLEDPDTELDPEKESVIAVPVGNWTERGAKVKNVRSVELVEAPDIVISPIAAEDDPADGS